MECILQIIISRIISPNLGKKFAFSVNVTRHLKANATLLKLKSRASNRNSLCALLNFLAVIKFTCRSSYSSHSRKSKRHSNFAKRKSRFSRQSALKRWSALSSVSSLNAIAYTTAHISTPYKLQTCESMALKHRYLCSVCTDSGGEHEERAGNRDARVTRPAPSGGGLSAYSFYPLLRVPPHKRIGLWSHCSRCVHSSL